MRQKNISPTDYPVYTHSPERKDERGAVPVGRADDFERAKREDGSLQSRRERAFHAEAEISVREEPPKQGGVVFGRGFENRRTRANPPKTDKPKEREMKEEVISADITPERARTGIVLSEILGPPKARKYFGGRR